MIFRCYLEITNRCNLQCVFCPGTDRPSRRLTVEEFEVLTNRLRNEVQFLYFHLMGEPLLHPDLPHFVRTARAKGFVPVLTTNGTLLERRPELAECGLHKIQISLHAHEGNEMTSPERYLHHVMTFALRAAAAGVIVVLRLWNQGGFDQTNDALLDIVAQYAPRPWTQRYDGWKLCERLYVEYDRMFEWPDEQGVACGEEEVFCYALRNQIGVLADGTVVPCCLDSAGAIPLGNLFVQSLQEIISSPRARALYEGFSRHIATEELCKRCNYAAVTKRFRK